MNFATAQRIAYPLRDPVDADLNRYLAKQDKEDARAAEIDAIADNLLKDDYAPFLPQNVAEAIGEMPQDKLEELAINLKCCAYEVIGQSIKRYIEAYWVDSAKRKAEKMFDEQDPGCSNCSGRNNCEREC